MQFCYFVRVAVCVCVFFASVGHNTAFVTLGWIQAMSGSEAAAVEQIAGVAGATQYSELMKCRVCG